MRFMIILLGVGLVAGCSSSNSGSSSANGGWGITRSDADFEGARTLAPNEKLSEAEGALEVRGRAVKSTVNAQSFSDFSNSDLVVISSADQEALRFVTDDGIVEFDGATLADAEAYFGGLVLAGEDADGTEYYAVDPNASPNGGYEYMAFAGWGQSIIDNETLRDGATINFGSVGNPTQESDMPSGSATYSGESIGVMDTPSFALITTSNIKITTPDYKSVTVGSSNTRIAVGGNNSAPGLDYTAKGTVSGNGFSASGDGINVDGDFFGPGAAEAGGTFSGTRTYRGEQATYGGAFGAKKVN